MTNRIAPSIAAIALVVIGPIASAEDAADVHPYLKNGVFVDAGMFFPRRELELSVSGTIDPVNDSIDVAETFGLANSDSAFALEFGWRFAKRWSLSAQHFQVKDAANFTIATDVEWEDVVYPVGANIDFETDLSLTRAFVGRQFSIGSQRSELGVGVGIHWLEIGATIEGEALIGSGSTAIRRNAVSAEGPLPNIGGWYRYSITPKLAFRARLDWLEASVGDYDGLLVNIGAGVNYQLLDYLGIGLNYNYFELDVSLTENDWIGEVKTSYSGVYVNLSAFF